MTKTPMPRLGSQSNAGRRVVPRCYGAAEWKRVEAATTPTAKKYFLRDLVLDTEKEFMELNEDFVVGNKTIDREQIIAKFRNKENIFKLNGRG